MVEKICGKSEFEPGINRRNLKIWKRRSSASLLGSVANRKNKSLGDMCYHVEFGRSVFYFFMRTSFIDNPKTPVYEYLEMIRQHQHYTD